MLLSAFLSIFFVLANLPSPSRSGHSFLVVGDNFEKDGQPFRIVSGSLHYFRVLPSLWQDRLHKLRLMGLNTIQTYLAWNFHQPDKDSPPNFADASRDVVNFVKLAEKEDLLVIVRPGPYICTEWDWGGLPSWLMSDPDVVPRCSNERYLEAVDVWMEAVLTLLSPYQYNLGGGPIILSQIENEYGNYGNDHTYLEHLVELHQKYGWGKTALYASDGASELSLEGGTLPSLVKTVNFAWKSSFRDDFGILRKFQPTGPVFCTEWWVAWYDFWGGSHQTASAVLSAVELDRILRYTPAGNASLVNINLYMAHGGTNFGFFNGADLGAHGYEPMVTSYDYDAPLNESGDPTEKYHAFRDVIGRFVPLPPGPIPTPARKAKYGCVEMTQIAYFVAGSPSSSPSNIAKNLATLSTSSLSSATPKTMGELGQDYGFVLYQTNVRGPLDASHSISLQFCRDRCHVMLDGERKGIIYRNDKTLSVEVSVSKTSQPLEVLVENMGRLKSGCDMMTDIKGITENARLDGQFLYGWKSNSLPLMKEQLSKLIWETLPKTRAVDAVSVGTHPAFFRGFLNVSDPTYDTFLQLNDGSLSTWSKGSVFINGFNLGRYWETAGPQRTLYVPAPLLVSGMNELIVLELDTPPLEAPGDKSPFFTDVPKLS